MCTHTHTCTHTQAYERVCVPYMGFVMLKRFAMGWKMLKAYPCTYKQTRCYHDLLKCVMMFTMLIVIYLHFAGVHFNPKVNLKAIILILGLRSLAFGVFNSVDRSEKDVLKNRIWHV